MKTAMTLVTGCLVVLACGCGNGGTATSPLVEQIQQLTRDKAELQTSLDRSTSENQQLKKQVDTLAALPDNVKGRNLYRIEKIKITRYTNLYDKDRDGKKEKLIVYIQPIDDAGDITKAPGRIEIQLWNLNNPAENALLAEWTAEPEQLKKLWFSSVLTSNYRLTFDVADKIKDPPEPLTVKVAFADLLSGKTFNEQYLIEP